MRTRSRIDHQPLQTVQTAPLDMTNRDDHFLPPRKTVHPAEKDRWTRIFYRSLLWLFISLVVGLLVWGNQFMWNNV